MKRFVDCLATCLTGAAVVSLSGFLSLPVTWGQETTAARPEIEADHGGPQYTEPLTQVHSPRIRFPPCCLRAPESLQKFSTPRGP